MKFSKKKSNILSIDAEKINPDSFLNQSTLIFTLQIIYKFVSISLDYLIYLKVAGQKNKQMRQSPLDSAKRINLLFGKMLINVPLMQKYKQISGNDLIDNFKELIKLKKPQLKQQLIDKMVQYLNSLTDFKNQKIRMYLCSNKKTQLGKFISLLLMPDKELRNDLQEKRKKLMLCIKNGQKFILNDKQLVQTLYLTLFSTKQNLMQQQSNQSHKNFKSLLISLKKMMSTAIAIKQTVSKYKKQTMYPLNLDVKQLLIITQNSLHLNQTSKKLEKIIQNSKHKNWLGPRLFKLLQKQNWDIINIKIFINALESVNLEQNQFRTKISTIRKTREKIIINLKKYLFSLIQKQGQQNFIRQEALQQKQGQFINKLCIKDIHKFRANEDQFCQKDKPNKPNSQQQIIKQTQKLQQFNYQLGIEDISIFFEKMEDKQQFSEKQKKDNP